ncbi:hypothetical protein PhCBS80983_g02095 [Powellomyces hirtus]|uniref:CAP-Gly domain-containing protein n=1 Tax=Powellomyces hirtus TaxID=109895 RepID=A0A507E7Y3_9FUNG|nr:hypothetical protein PhCBS80983_g02095 [Powellomyces hirtus]
MLKSTPSIHQQSLVVGSRICVGSHFGTIRFHGAVPAGSGNLWYGVEWDDATRGKHSGTHGGVEYFKTSVPNSGTFIREAKVTDECLPRSFIDAMSEKYLAAQPKDTVTRVGWSAGGVEVETVGWDKIARKVKQGDRLREVGVADMRVGFRGGLPGEVRQMFPAIVDLDMSRALFRRWRDVAEICRELPELESLRLAYNRFAPFREEEKEDGEAEPAGDVIRGAFANVKALTLLGTTMAWTEVQVVAKWFPALQELHFGFNQLSVFGAAVKSTGLESIRVLILEHNGLSSWDEIRRLGKLPALTALMLNGNAIRSIEPLSSDGSEFTSLKSLNISDNLLDSWTCIHSLNTFPALTEVRVRRNPVLAQLRPEDVHSILVARLSKVDMLNGNEVTPRFRRDAELFYLTRCATELAAAVSASTSSTSSTPLPLSFALTHPRYQDLVAIHGAPAVAPKSATSNILKDRILLITFSYDGKVSRKKIPANMNVRPLRVLVSRVFKIAPAATVTLTKVGKDGGGEVTLGDDLRDVGFYGLECGDTIRLDVK